ncbi:hypothetical protein [Paraconexibacter sp.]|uniref:hypothetical protein n=1 Tax=Paraconexibacter sp. TaxID=2949640 RepID=UPI003567442D
MAAQVLQGAARVFPDLLARPGFAEAVAVGLATMRGLALDGFLPGSDPEALWPAAREHLLALFERAAGAADSPRGLV